MFSKILGWIRSIFQNSSVKGKEKTSDIIVKSKTIQKRVGGNAINVTKGREGK